MWVLGKVRESMESIPLKLDSYIGKRDDDALFSSKTSLSQNLHANIITPNNIPEFCLPPRLCKRHPKSEKSEDPSVPQKAPRKPLPFSAECYGLAGMYESPNTRRKESLFHSKRPVYMFERRIPTTKHRQMETTPLKKTFLEFLPLFAFKSLSEAASTEAEIPSSAKPPRNVRSRSQRLKETVSCPSLFDIMEKSIKAKKLGLSLPTFSWSRSTSERNPPTLSPPVLHPLDFLHCQERLHHEHILSLQGRGRVRFSTEHTTFSNGTSTIRVRVVSVEGLLDQTEQQTLNCAVNLCLTPGKLQQQESAIIRNCRCPVFNEDFYFTELSHKDLLELQLRLKVVDKAAAGAFRRGIVIGIIFKSLSQLLSTEEQV